MIERRKKLTARIGVFAVAHHTYFGQFPGLYENLMGYHGDFCRLIRENQVEIVDLGILDDSEKAYAAARSLQEADVDLIFCNMDSPMIFSFLILLVLYPASFRICITSTL